MDKALIAMSGGVDSSAAALLMKRAGYDCIGAVMRLLPPSEKLRDAEEDARSVCERLEIPFRIFDFTEEFSGEVIEKFACSYERGETPNPCIECNRSLKFGALYRKAEELGCRYIVTGHYARTEYDEARGQWLLKKALNASKDQSYVLYSLTREQLAHTLFPLGGFADKSEVRRLAEESGLLNSAKRESQDICFIPDGDYASFVRGFRGTDYPEGDFIGTDGQVLGRHKGIVNYTVGQRKGLGISYSEPLYVQKKTLADNTVTLCTERELYTDSLTARDFNWIVPCPDTPVTVRTRYHGREASAVVTTAPDSTVTVRFAEPQRAIAPGQAVVLYDSDVVIGGGTIHTVDQTTVSSP